MEVKRMTAPGRRTIRGLVGLLGMFLFAAAGLLNGPRLVTAAHAGEAVPRLDQRDVRFGTVWRVRGQVTAQGNGSGSQRVLREGDTVFVGERIQAASTGEAVVKTDDAGVVALRPGAAFVIERFSAQGLPSDQFALRVLSGALRAITGWIGRHNRSQTRFVTLTATIGIRGTDHELYVMTTELARTLRQEEGTYNKVNRGGTTLEAGGRTLDIDQGRVGFAPAAPRIRTRGLLTVLLPILLDTVPDFFVPGAFDAELDRLSPDVDAESERALRRRQLENQRNTPASPPEIAPREPAPSLSAPSARPEPTADQPAAPLPAETAPALLEACDAEPIARTWLLSFDTAVLDRNAQAIVQLFAPDVVVRTNVRATDGTVTSEEMNRDQLAQSAIAAMSRLTDYQQRRPSTEAQVLAASAGNCQRIAVRSVAIEQGRQGVQPYRFEAIEEYVLELRNGQWLAVSASTTQR